MAIVQKVMGHVTIVIGIGVPVVNVEKGIVYEVQTLEAFNIQISDHDHIAILGAAAISLEMMNKEG